MESWTPRHPVVRALGARIPLGRPLGVPVELHVLAIVLSVGLFTWEWSRAGVPFLGALLAAVVAATVLYTAIWAHEMGHVLAGRRWNIPTHKITLWPLGGLAHLSEPAPHPRADIVIALAGPATHVLSLAVAWPLHVFFPYASGPLVAGVYPLGVAVSTFFYLQVMLALFNLLPFLPMDGGRVLMGVLAMRQGEVRALRIASRVGLAGAFLLAIYALFFSAGWQGGLLLAIAVSNGLICWQLVKASRFGARWYADRARDPWEADPEAWRSGAGKGGAGADADERRAKKAARKEAARMEREQAQRAADDDEMDRLLARVSEVGLAGLSRAERRRLEALSKRRGT